MGMFAARAVLAVGTGWLALVAAAEPQSSSADTELRKEVEALRSEVKSLRSELDQVKATLHGLTVRQNPIFDLSGAPSIGDLKASVVLIEFSDYQCPYCMDYFSNTYRKIIDEYVKSGKVRYVVRDFPGESAHPNALKAAEAARCAKEQGKFWEMHDSLFTNQRNLPTTGITDSARTAGLDLAAFQTCLDSGKHTAGVRKDEEETVQLGVKGTPAFFFGTPDPANPSRVKLVTALIGGQPLQAFQKVIDSLLVK
jgi:protein-disulfide isomerase